MPNRHAWFAYILKNYKRIGLTGPPKSGKSTLSRRATRPVIHSDNFNGFEWSEASQKLAEHVNAINGPLLVEGVRVPHAVRKGMKVDVLIVLADPVEVLSPRQSGMGKAIETVIRELKVPIIRAPKFPKGDDDEEETDEE